MGPSPGCGGRTGSSAIQRLSACGEGISAAAAGTLANWSPTSAPTEYPTRGGDDRAERPRLLRHVPNDPEDESGVAERHDPQRWITRQLSRFRRHWAGTARAKRRLEQHLSPTGDENPGRSEHERAPRSLRRSSRYPTSTRRWSCRRRSGRDRESQPETPARSCRRALPTAPRTGAVGAARRRNMHVPISVAAPKPMNNDTKCRNNTVWYVSH